MQLRFIQSFTNVSNYTVIASVAWESVETSKVVCRLLRYTRNDVSCLGRSQSILSSI
jgi:hypothetical protein